MDIEEESWMQSELLGEHPELPKTQWESIEEIVLADVEETSPIYPQRRPQFFEDLEVGYL
jgi:hypothetical protein